MKKAILTLALGLMGFAASAQFVVGGEISLNHTGSKIEDNNTEAQTSFTITPKVGYWLNNKIQVGAAFGYVYQQDRTYSTYDNEYTSVKQGSYLIAPYLRYNIAQWRKATFFAEAQIGFSATPKASYYNSRRDESWDGDTKTTSFAVSVVPGLNYSLTNHLSLDLYVNLMGLGYYYTTSKTDGVDYYHHGLNCVANANAQTLEDHLNLFSIGFNYAF